MGNKKDRKAAEKKAAAARRADQLPDQLRAVLDAEPEPEPKEVTELEHRWFRCFKMWSPHWLPFCLFVCFIMCIHTFNILRARFLLAPPAACVLSVSLVSANVSRSSSVRRVVSRASAELAAPDRSAAARSFIVAS